MQKLPPYVLIEHPTELKDKTLILQTVPPFLVGQVWRFADAESVADFEERNKNRCYVASGTYRIILTEYTTLAKSNLGGIGVTNVLGWMYDFYHKERILPNAPRFNRYRIDRDA